MKSRTKRLIFLAPLVVSILMFCASSLFAEDTVQGTAYTATLTGYLSRTLHEEKIPATLTIHFAVGRYSDSHHQAEINHVDLMIETQEGSRVRYSLIHEALLDTDSGQINIVAEASSGGGKLFRILAFCTRGNIDLADSECKLNPRNTGTGSAYIPHRLFEYNFSPDQEKFTLTKMN